MIVYSVDVFENSIVWTPSRLSSAQATSPKIPKSRILGEEEQQVDIIILKFHHKDHKAFY